MDASSPSKTALAAAAYRAAHQVLEEGRIFPDPLALRILGGEAAAEAVRHAREDAGATGMRLFIAARSRFADERAHAAIARGVEQVVILGAGLDTFAYRTPHRGRLSVFEVDHPATQEWKRRMLAHADIVIPDGVRFVPVDFEREAISDALAGAGFDAGAAAFFVWLGVVPYLSTDAVVATLSFIGSLRGGGQVVFDYSEPRDSLDAAGRARHEALAARVATLGEAIITHFAAEQLHDVLAGAGFTKVEDLGPADIAQRYYRFRGGTRRRRGAHLVGAEAGRAGTM